MNNYYPVNRIVLCLGRGSHSSLHGFYNWADTQAKASGKHDIAQNIIIIAFGQRYIRRIMQ